MKDEAIPEMIEIQEKPLISFILLAYNQERFIREAVEGAFSQTYSPLEIILSDDCSSDRTFEIMQEMAQNYTGPHKIILNRNEKNLGIGAHINKLMELAQGELIVAAAGDDISEPERTSVVVECYISHGRIPCSIYSDANNINTNGTFLKYNSNARSQGYFLPISFVKSKFWGVLGASHIWHRCLFDKFGPLSPNIINEDCSIPFRASLLGKVIYIPQALVRYRFHSSSVQRNAKNAIEQQFNYHKRRLAVYDNNLRDLLYYCTFINADYQFKEDIIKEIFKQRNLTKRFMSLYINPLHKNIFSFTILFISGNFSFFRKYIKAFFSSIHDFEFLQRILKRNL